MFLPLQVRFLVFLYPLFNYYSEFMLTVHSCSHLLKGPGMKKIIFVPWLRNKNPVSTQRQDSAIFWGFLDFAPIVEVQAIFALTEHSKEPFFWEKVWDRSISIWYIWKKCEKRSTIFWDVRFSSWFSYSFAGFWHGFLA
jgi:hypothetical protein